MHGFIRDEGAPRAMASRAPTLLVVLMLLASPLVAVASSPNGGDDAEGGESRAASDPNEWLTFKGDKQRTGESASTAPSVDKVLWTVNYKGSLIYSSPTVWNGTVFVGVSGTIKAIWAKNGTERWSYTAPNPVHTSPVIEDGVIYAGANDFSGMSAVAVDALTGEEVWNASIPDFVTSAPLVLGNSVYVGCQNGILYCLRKSDGREQWNFTADRSILYGSIASKDDLIYFGIEGDTEDRGKVYAVNSNTGMEEWNRTIIGSVWSSPTVTNGDVLVSTAGDKRVGVDGRKGFVYAFNATTGDQKWRTDDLGMVMASPSVKDGRVYVGSFGKFILDLEVISPQMYCIDLANGDIIWNQTVTHQGDRAKVWSSVTIAGSLIVFGDELGYLNVWNKNGVKIWSHSINPGAAVKTTPAVAGEMIYAANTMGDVVAYGSQPDLSVNATVISLEDEFPHLGQRVRVKAKVSNIGDKTAIGRVFMYNGSLDDWHTVINGTTVTLEPGSSEYVEAVWTADEVGTRAVWVRIMDVRPNEADLTNNEAKRVVEVLPPAVGWLTARSDPSGDGYLFTEPPVNNVTKWLRAEGAKPGPGLAATNESVLFPVGQKLVAMDRLNGDVQWSRDLGGRPTTPPGVGDGHVYIGTEPGLLKAFDLEDGTNRWTVDLGGEVTAGPTVLGWTLLVGTSEASDTGTLWALDTFSGAELWNRSMSAPVKAHPAIFGPRVYAVSDDGAVLALNLTDGGLQWQYPVGNPPGRSLTASPVVTEEHIYVASSSGFVYCLDSDPSDGVDEGKDDPDGAGYDVLWTYRQEESLPFNSSPVLVDGMLVLVTIEDDVIALNVTNGTIAWTVPMAAVGPVTTQPIALNGTIVLGGKGAHILTADAGVVNWSYTGSGAIMMGDPVAVDGMLFLSDSRGIVFAFGKVRNLPPVARISSPVADSQFRINESITFDASETTDDKDLPDTSFKWDFGDGNVSLSKVTSHPYAVAGFYTVVLTVTDTDGEADNTSITIRVLENHAPILDWWDVAPDQGYALLDEFNFSVRYTDPDNDPPEFIVLRLSSEPEYQPLTMREVDPSDTDYRDGKLYFFIVTLGSRPYPSVTFRASDGISVSELVIWGPTVLMERTFPNSVGDIEVTVVYVGPHPIEFTPVTSPPSSFPPGLHPINVYVELFLNTTFLKTANISVNYSFHDVEDMDLGTLAVYRWSVSDAEAGWQYIPDSAVDLQRGLVSAPIPSLHNDIYTVLGNRLNPPPNHKPVAIIKVDGRTYATGAQVERSYSPGEVIEFDAGDSYDPDEEALFDRIVEYSWSFGDGTNQNSKVARHSFEVASTKYSVTLSVKDSYGETSEVTVIISVRAEEESTLLYLLVIVGIIVILLLLFYPKGTGRKPSRPEPKEPIEGVEEDEVAPEDEVEEEDDEHETELDNIIDELEEDRSR